MLERLKLLAEKAVANHAITDIVKHLREELHELDSAFDNLEKGRGTIDQVAEEAADVCIEGFTMLLLLNKKFNQMAPEDRITQKLDKFEALLVGENAAMVRGELEFPVDRYKNGLANGTR
jgi:Fe-S cluster biosynthesis and repair protein YggX